MLIIVWKSYHMNTIDGNFKKAGAEIVQYIWLEITQI